MSRLLLALLAACGVRGDADGDGFAPPDDCDDARADVHPGAEELWYDGLDQDCAGDDDFDADGDGYASATYNGADCDDADPEVGPGAEDPDGDGVDQGCDDWADTGAWDLPSPLDADGDGFLSRELGGLDCDDEDAEVYPGSGLEDCLSCDDATALRVPEDYGTLAEALAVAPSGAVLCLSEGRWEENLEFDGTSVAILGVEGAALTSLDGGGLAAVLSVSDAELYLGGLALTGGSSEQGGALALYSASVALRDLVIRDNQAGEGGGIFGQYTDLRVMDTLVAANEATDLGGGGMYCGTCRVELVGVALLGNVAAAGEALTGGGGALSLQGVSAGSRLQNVVVAGNVTTGRGGGLYLAHVEGMALDHLSLVGNTGLNGGGIFAFGLEEAITVTSSVASHNQATDAVDGIWIYYVLDEASFAWSDLWDEGGGGVRQGTAGETSWFFSDEDLCLSADPLFSSLDLSADPETWDLSPGAGSPLIDAANPDEEDADGTPADIGATGGPSGL